LVKIILTTGFKKRIMFVEVVLSAMNGISSSGNSRAAFRYIAAGLNCQDNSSARPTRAIQATPISNRFGVFNIL
jgi:hypothetical protein